MPARPTNLLSRRLDRPALTDGLDFVSLRNPGHVMVKLINELLLLTCMGAFIASATYAVTLLH